MQESYLIFKYRPPGPPAGLLEQDMPTIYSRKTNPKEIPYIGDIVSLPTEDLDLPTSDVKEQQGEREMGFKVVDRHEGGSHPETGGRRSVQQITLVVTNFDA